jgi:rubrerythrin
MNQEIQRAVKKMIHVELDAMNYYQQATRYMKDQGAIDHFNQLAKEEQDHAQSFYDIYPGDDLPTFAEIVQNQPEESPLIKSIDGELMARIDERQALQLAIRLEQEVEGSLRRMALQAGDPAVKMVLEKNAESTLNHLLLIKEDYQRLYGDLSG